MFIKGGYPKSMVENISKKVLTGPRVLVIPPENNPSQDEIKKSIQIVSTFGTDKDIIKAVSNAELKLLATQTFSNYTKPLFSRVKKNAPSIGSKLSIVKKIALESQYVGTSKCGSPRCQCDILVPDTPLSKIIVNGCYVNLPKADCYSYNILYVVSCGSCDKVYIGRSTQKLHLRCNGHRNAFYKILRNGLSNNYSNDKEDLYSLGMHLRYEHGLASEVDFNNTYTFHVLQHCSPSQLEKREHIWIHRLNTLHPCGINKINPFGLPIWTCLQ